VRLLRDLAGVTVGAMCLACVCLIVLFLKYVWELHPWVPPGRDVYISDQRLLNYDFQVWQRKNPSMFEPFTTGLFVRKDGGEWHAFWIGFEDSYRPKIALRTEGSKIVVISDGETIGTIDREVIVFRRKSDSSAFSAAVIQGKPPGEWWLEGKAKVGIAPKGN
jgi:hypothetical protein